MYIQKSLDSVRAGLEADRERYHALAAAWKSVAVKTKKNGEEFQNIANAVDGAKVSKNYCDEREVMVFCKNVPRNKMYIDDGINLSVYSNGIARERSAEELRKAIAERIEAMEEHEREAAEALETIEEDYRDYVAAIEQANAVSKRRGERSATYYALYDVVR